MNELSAIISRANQKGICVSAFNVPYLPMVQPIIEAVVAGSRLPLEENIAVAKRVAELAHDAGLPCEPRLGAASQK